jgi:hypothetical protein
MAVVWSFLSASAAMYDTVILPSSFDEMVLFAEEAED